MNFIEQPARIVVQVFRSMTKEEKDRLRDQFHVLFFNLEDLEQMVDSIDHAKGMWQQQKEQAERALESLNE
jgi:hypothetical protein